ncbi:glycosyltransferase family A protein [Paracoccus sp. DMF-8]|nr:glycosyltransferase family A protein [Paracoccus sp. DMF-8]MDF3605837.1 glycosyltransferase family A protein [Paracoccus sp. DMF-8]
MSNPPKPAPVFLSIVIPTFRREALLAPLLHALDAQISSLQSPVEVILVDNSPEGSAAQIGRPPFIRYVHEPRPGVAQARNRGVNESAGSHVVFLDDDETPFPGWLAAFEAAAMRGAAVCFGAIEP